MLNFRMCLNDLQNKWTNQSLILCIDKKESMLFENRVFLNQFYGTDIELSSELTGKLDNSRDKASKLIPIFC